MAASADFDLLDEQARITIAQLRLVVQGIERAVSLYQTKSISDLLSAVQGNVNESLKLLEVWIVNPDQDPPNDPYVIKVVTRFTRLRGTNAELNAILHRGLRRRRPILFAIVSHKRLALAKERRGRHN